jgi:hypothetical protein
LYTTGKIKVIQSTGINTPTIKTGVLQNPTQGIFKVTVENVSGSYKMLISDLNGKILRESDEVDTNVKIDLTNMADGVYLLKITSNGEYSNILRLVKAGR